MYYVKVIHKRTWASYVVYCYWAVPGYIRSVIYTRPRGPKEALMTYVCGNSIKSGNTPHAEKTTVYMYAP